MTAKAGVSYADMVRTLKEKVDPEKSGTTILNIRRTRTDDLLVVLKKNEKNKEFQDAMRGALGQDAEVRDLEFRDFIDVQIRDIEEDVTLEEVQKAVENAIGASKEARFSIRKGFAGMNMATIRKVERKSILALLKEGHLKIGWVNCRIREIESKLRCFRCFHYGHTGRNCRGLDRSKACFKCGGLDGHKVEQCQGTEICFMCKDREGANYTHRTGSRDCRSYNNIMGRLKGGKNLNS